MTGSCPERLLAPAFVAQQGRLHDGLVGADEAANASWGSPRRTPSILRRVLLQIPGFRVKASAGKPATALEFSQLSTTSGLMHTFASPAVAYLLFVIGLSLILFELYTAGVGIAGLVGAGSLIFGCYGLGVLPIRPVAIALILVSMVAFAVDVQIGVPRAWTVIGAVVFAVGSLLLYQGLPIAVARDGRRHRRRGALHGGGHARDDSHALLDPIDRPGVAGRQDRARCRRARPRGRCADRRGSVGRPLGRGADRAGRGGAGRGRGRCGPARRGAELIRGAFCSRSRTKGLQKLPLVTVTTPR